MSARRRRGNREGSVFRRKDGRWAASITVGYDAHGRQRKRTVYGRTRSEVAQKLASLLSDQREGRVADPSKETVGQFLERWLRDYAANSVRPSTLASYAIVIRRHIIPAIGSLRLRDLQTGHLQRLYREKLEGGRADGKEGGLSGRYVAYMHSILHNALDQAVKEGLLPRNPADAARKPRVRGREIRPLTREEQAVFLRGAKDDELFAAWFLLLATGLRRGELLGLRWGDVDLDGAVLHVRQAVVPLHGRAVISDVKTDAGRRSVSLPREAVRILRRHHAAQAERKLALGAAYQDHDLVFCYADGRPWDPRAFSRRFERLMKRLGLGGHTLHDLRHTHATRLLEAGVNPKAVQERLGHASVGVTLDVYSHVLPSLQREVADKIDAILRL